MDPFKLLDDARVWRLLELSDLRTLHGIIEVDSHKSILNRSAVLLSYAHWEGFYANCCDILMDYAVFKERKCNIQGTNIALAAMYADFDRLFSRGNNPESKLEFYRSIKDHQNRDLNKADRSLIKPRSNLNFEKLSFSLSVLGKDIKDFQSFRLKIDRELVHNRHSIAHGSAVEMSSSAFDDLTRLAENLMEITKNIFEDLVVDVG